MKDEFWEHACGMMPLWDSLAVVNTVIVLLLGLSFLFVERGTGAFVAGVLTFVVVVTYFAVYAVVKRACVRREEV